MKEMKDDNDKIKQVFDSYDTSCPFELARHFDIQIKYFDFTSNILGYYTPMLSSVHIIINENLLPEEQEKICDHLIAHHILHEGKEFCLDLETFKNLEKKTRFSPYLLLHKKISFF